MTTYSRLQDLKLTANVLDDPLSVFKCLSPKREPWYERLKLSIKEKQNLVIKRWFKNIPFVIDHLLRMYLDNLSPYNLISTQGQMYSIWLLTFFLLFYCLSKPTNHYLL